MAKVKKDDLKDEETVTFEITQRNDGKMWMLTITCETPLSSEEFAAACLCFGNDALNQELDFENCDSMEQQ